MATFKQKIVDAAAASAREHLSGAGRLGFGEKCWVCKCRRSEDAGQHLNVVVVRSGSSSGKITSRSYEFINKKHIRQNRSVVEPVLTAAAAFAEELRWQVGGREAYCLGYVQRDKEIVEEHGSLRASR
ncbi:hypothetical protein C1H46_029490 [Malus baccata]|uniref:Uncharacterized protein n=1 Tax=Malus baccata TaxID=106549 RepID=A0A540LEU5_MALBA|nr:hypothetical protein C1H46_029490 [Malus baccata]